MLALCPWHIFIFVSTIRYREALWSMVQVVAGSNPGWASRRQENSVNPAVNGYLFFESGKNKAAKCEGWASPFICYA